MPVTWNKLRQWSIRLFMGMAFFWGAIACGITLTVIEVEKTAQGTIQGLESLDGVLDEVELDEFLTVDFGASHELQNQGARPGDVRDARIVFFKLSAIDGNGQDLSFLERIEIYIQSPGLKKRKIAWSNRFPKGTTSVEFEVEDVDLTPYTTAPTMSLHAEVAGRPPELDTRVYAETRFDIGVTVQGACAAYRASP